MKSAPDNLQPLCVMQLVSSLEVGGAEKLLMNLLATAGETGAARFVVVVMNESVDSGMRDELDRLGLPVYYLNRPEGHLHYRYLAELRGIIRRHGIRVIHAHNHGSKMWGVLCKLTTPGLRLVYTIHDTMMVPRLNKLQRWVHRHAIDLNIAISRAVAAQCDGAGIDNYRQIYNGIPLRRFEKVRENRPPSREHGPLQILHVGRMTHSIKGQDILIRAIAHCRDEGLDVRARLMGGVYFYNEKGFAELQQLVADLDLQGRIEFLVNRSDVPGQLAHADLFVLPSRKEGLGLVVLEAMAAGVPVIASNVDGPRELIRDGVNGFLFESGNPLDLAARIRMVCENPGLADQVRREAAGFVKQFDIRLMASAYEALYLSLVATAHVSTLPDVQAEPFENEARLPDGSPV